MATEKYGRYEVIQELGRGGMATVYVAHDPRFDRDVALKVLPPGFLQDPTFLKRFDIEAKFIAQLEHAAIVPVYDYGEDHGRPYLVMRLMLGGTLRDRINKGPLPPDDVVVICQRICWALEKAHSRGIIHRDIKPPNILCDEDGAAYLADFGIARLAEATQTVTAMGTPQYIAPEQVYGTALDGRTDIYQMGVVLFEMLTGRRPFEADNSAALIYKHCHERVPSARSFNPALNAVADAVIERAMAKEMQDRYATAGEFAAAVAKIPLARPGAQPREEATDYHPPDLKTREKRGRRPAGKPPERATPPREDRVLVETEPWMPLEAAELAGRKETEPATPPPRDDGLELVDSDPKMPWQEGASEPEPEPEPPAEPETAVATASPRRPEEPSLGAHVQIAAPPAPPAKPSRSRLARVLERRKYEHATEERQVNYRHYLAERRGELQRLRDEHLAALHRRDPSAADCLAQMEKDPACLWAKTSEDTNFLALRMGRG
ncbi:MAG TPA: serine/threonine protein kinase, partial [Chromatiales bacterium]|nr:serine/threonine protein kinase [Chromatiales bacterium]